jgi:hypothetical protein
MAELLITAGATALACSSVLSSFYDNPFTSSSSAAQGGSWLSNSSSTQVVRRHYPPGALPADLHKYVINPSPPSYSANSLFDDRPAGGGVAQPPPSTPVEVIRNDDGVRITHGGSSAPSVAPEQQQSSPFFPANPESFPFGTSSSSMSSWSSSSTFGDRSGFPPMSPFGTNPFFNSFAGPFSAFPGFNTPQLNGTAGAPTEGTQTVVVQNPDGSYTATQTTVHRSGGGSNAASKTDYSLRHMLYFYGLIPSMAMWRTHKVWTKNEAFLTNELIPIWTRSNYLGSRVVLQTAYATCMTWAVYCWLSQRCGASPSGFGAPATPLDVLSAPAALGAISQSQRLSLFDHDAHHSPFGSNVGSGVPVRDVFSSASDQLNSLAWSLFVWPTFVFVGTSLITIPFGIIGARLGLVIRSGRGFGPLGNLGKLK